MKLYVPYYYSMNELIWEDILCKQILENCLKNSWKSWRNPGILLAWFCRHPDWFSQLFIKTIFFSCLFCWPPDGVRWRCNITRARVHGHQRDERTRRYNSTRQERNHIQWRSESSDFSYWRFLWKHTWISSHVWCGAAPVPYMPTCVTTLVVVYPRGNLQL